MALLGHLADLLEHLAAVGEKVAVRKSLRISGGYICIVFPGRVGLAARSSRGKQIYTECELVCHGFERWLQMSD